MLRIAICDDEEIICRQLEDMLFEIGDRINLKIESEIFYSGEELYRFLFRGNRYDIIFLDIELNRINGVEVGRRIRDELKDEFTQIVYISCNEGYAMELFDVRPLNFIIKPLGEEKIEAVLTKAAKLLDKENKFFEYRNGNVTFSVPLREILYFESCGRKVNMILENEIKTFYGKLSSVEDKVKNCDFIIIHKSYLINFNYCTEYNYEYVKMSNQEILTISQNNRKAVRERLLQRKLREYHD